MMQASTANGHRMCPWTQLLIGGYRPPSEWRAWDSHCLGCGLAMTVIRKPDRTHTEIGRSQRERCLSPQVAQLAPLL
jgi:hypothetical protein